MAKFLPCLLVSLCLASLGHGAENILTLLKGPCGADDIHRQLAVTPPGDLNTLADEDGKTGLFFCRHLGTTLLLLDGANPDVRDHAGQTPAFRAVTKSADPAFPIMLELLALAHTDVNARDHDGNTLLAWAAREDNASAVRLLLLLGADPAPGDVAAEHSPLFYALQNHDDRLADQIRRASQGTAEGSTTASNPATLAAAARAASLGELSDALAHGADINARDDDGATALFRAVADRRADVAALLLLNGADPSIAKHDGKTPLMQVAAHFDMVSERMLVELILAGADVNATAKDGATPLSESIEAENNTAAQWFIWRGADLEVHAPNGTLMQIAATHPDWPSAIQLLKDAGLKEEAPLIAKEKSFILFNAVRAGDLPAVDAALAGGTPVDVTNQYDQTALEWAICYEKTNVVDLLLRHGANINHQHYYNGEHLLHMYAATKGRDTVFAAAKMQTMLNHGANPNLLMLDGCTPLMVAAREGTTGPALDLLLDKTSDLNAKDKHGLTALALARQRGHAEIVKTLQARGALE